jgi:hypothetical protein
MMQTLNRCVNEGYVVPIGDPARGRNAKRRPGLPERRSVRPACEGR